MREDRFTWEVDDLVIDKKAGKLTDQDKEFLALLEEGTKQFPEPTPTGHALPPLEGQPEITPEQVAEALRDWDAKAPRGWQGLLLTEKAEDGG